MTATQTTASRLTSGTTSTGIALRVERDGDTARIVYAATGNTASDRSGPLVYNQGPGSWTCAREALALIINDPDATAEIAPEIAPETCEHGIDPAKCDGYGNIPFEERDWVRELRADIAASNPTARKIRIVGAEAREIHAHVTTLVRPGRNWSEVQSMRECGHGCKLHVRSLGGVREYQLWHSSVYGCQLGTQAGTRVVPVSVVLNG